MKKFILPVLLFLMFIPFYVNAETCDTDKITISSITMENKSDNVEELETATASGKNISLNLSMSEVGDNIEYKFVVKNDSNEDYELDKTSLNLKSDYINYLFKTDDNSNVVKPKTSKNVTLRVEYKTEVSEDKFENGTYNDSKTMTVNLSTGDTINVPDILKNPNTGVQSYIIILTLILIISITSCVILRKKKYAKFMILVIESAILIPISVYALCKCDIIIKTKIMIKKNYNPCIYEGELIQGAEYINGQYKYRYMMEGYDYTRWKNIEDDGWGVMLVNRTSTADIDTRMCTSINGKPIVSMAYLFNNARATSIDMSSFDTSNVKNMEYMFSSTNTQKIELNNLDTSNVVNMEGMFLNYKGTELDVRPLKTSKVTNMSHMFGYVKAGALDFSNFDTSNVNDMKRMFHSCKTINLDLSSFDTSKVTDMYSMFQYSDAIDLNISTFNTSNVTDMGFMFQEIKVKELDLSNFNTSKVTNMWGMFSSSQIENLNVSSFDTSNVTNMSWMFASIPATSINLNNFNTSNVNSMYRMFYESNIETLDLSNFDILDECNIGEMFYKSSIQSGYGKDINSVNKLNSSSRKPTSLTFTVK